MSDSSLNMVTTEIDIGIRIGALPGSSMIVVKLTPNKRELFAAPDYLTKAGIPVMPNELSEHQCVLLSTNGNSLKAHAETF